MCLVFNYLYGSVNLVFFSERESLGSCVAFSCVNIGVRKCSTTSTVLPPSKVRRRIKSVCQVRQRFSCSGHATFFHRIRHVGKFTSQARMRRLRRGLTKTLYPRDVNWSLSKRKSSSGHSSGNYRDEKRPVHSHAQAGRTYERSFSQRQSVKLKTYNLPSQNLTPLVPTNS